MQLSIGDDSRYRPPCPEKKNRRDDAETQNCRNDAETKNRRNDAETSQVRVL